MAYLFALKLRLVTTIEAIFGQSPLVPKNARLQVKQSGWKSLQLKHVGLLEIRVRRFAEPRLCISPLFIGPK